MLGLSVSAPFRKCNLGQLPCMAISGHVLRSHLGLLDKVKIPSFAPGSGNRVSSTCQLLASVLLPQRVPGLK